MIAEEEWRYALGRSPLGKDSVQPERRLSDLLCNSVQTASGVVVPPMLLLLARFTDAPHELFNSLVRRRAHHSVASFCIRRLAPASRLPVTCGIAPVRRKESREITLDGDVDRNAHSVRSLLDIGQCARPSLGHFRKLRHNCLGGCVNDRSSLASDPNENVSAVNPFIQRLDDRLPIVDTDAPQAFQDFRPQGCDLFDINSVTHPDRRRYDQILPGSCSVSSNAGDTTERNARRAAILWSAPSASHFLMPSRVIAGARWVDRFREGQK